MSGFLSQVRRGKNDGGSDSEDDDAEAYVMEEMAPPPGALPPMEKIDLDVRMDRLPPGQSVNHGGGGGGPPPGLRPTGGGLPSANTGPKGVLADFEEAKRNLKNLRLRERVGRDLAMMEKIATGQVGGNHQLSEKKNNRNDKDNNDEEDEDDEDAAAFAKYRQSRLEAMHAIQSSLPSFGTFERVDFAGMVSAIKSTDSHCYLVVHLYENDHPASVRLNLCLESISPRYPHCKFIRIRSTEAIATYSPAGLPTLIIYKGGEQIHSFVRISDSLPELFTSNDIIQYLQQYQILGIPTGEDDIDQRDQQQKENEKKKALRLKPKAIAKDSDSEDD